MCPWAEYIYNTLLNCVTALLIPNMQTQPKLHFVELGSPRMRFCDFRVLQNLKGYNLSGYMKRAQNSDPKTHVEK